MVSKQSRQIHQPHSSSRQRALRTGLRAGALALAIGLSLPAFAQSITGSLFGTAPSGKGDVIVVSNPATGFSKTVNIDSRGRYSLKLLTPGTYEVSLQSNGQTLGEYSVLVNAGASSPVPAFTAAIATSNATQLSTVQVTASAPATVINPIDVKVPQLKTVWNYHIIQQLPVPQQSIYAIPTLNSSVLTHDVQGLELPVSRGAGPTANRYYYNEFDTTYDVTGVGAIVFPQVAMGSTVYTGSNSSVDFTSTTGGVVAVTLKQGTNHFHGGVDAYWDFPTSRLFNPHSKNSYYTYQGNKLHYLYDSDNDSGPSLQTYVWGSGPIVKNKLFFYAMVGDQPAWFRNTSYGATTKDVSSSRSHSGLLNLTWDMTENQSLDVAGYEVRDKFPDNEFTVATPYTPSSVTGAPRWSGLQEMQKLFVANYHWYINPNMTLRLMAGYMRFDYNAANAQQDDPYAYNYSYVTGINQQVGYGPAYSPYHYYYAKRGYKGDFTWQLGEHTLTFGAERYTIAYHFVPVTNVNGYYQYYYDPAGAGSSLGAGIGNIPANGEYGYQYEFAGGGTFFSHNNGYYVSDNWQATSNVVIQGGLRLDQMKNLAANDEPYLRLTTLSPRLGVSWDVHGDSSLKIGANMGKFTLPLPSTVSYDNASSELYRLTYFSFTGINPDGTPAGKQTLGSPIVYADGSVPRLSNITSQGIKNTYQYEFQLYAQQKLGQNWQLLVDASASTLKNLIDTTCDQTGYISDYVKSHGHPNYPGLTGATGCIMFNPGKSIVLRDDLDGTGNLSDITLPQSYLGYPAASRHYYGLTLGLSHAATSAEPYFLRFSYTWSHLYGNSDGYVNVTKGSTSPTPGNSGNFQFPQFAAGNSGNLGEDVPNNFVFAGAYYFPDGFYVSSTLFAHSAIRTVAWACIRTRARRFWFPRERARTTVRTANWCRPAALGAHRFTGS